MGSCFSRKELEQISRTYAKDISMKARLFLAQCGQKGSYTGGLPPYGYVSEREEKMHCLMLDEKQQHFMPEENVYGIYKQGSGVSRAGNGGVL